ncbi:MAG: hypothetical protein LAP38_11885 [Acidobacteriia bacterium]|nr:hypothetical protein [Terriglobia bacterium]
MSSLEAVAEWFLRLNGFFTVQNFVVHPVNTEEGSQQRTDADVLGFRFPKRQEIVSGEPLVDHPAFQDARLPTFVIAEVKAGRCRLNGPWSRAEEGNVTNVLRSFGMMSATSLDAISKAFYENGRFQADDLDARLLCFGADRSRDLSEGVLQFTWEEIFGFIFDRYQAFWRAKRQNQQWPQIGRFLWDRSKHQEREHYVAEMLKEFGVGRAGE